MSDPGAPLLSDFIDPEKITYRLNTAGCFNTDDAIRALLRAHEAGSLDIVKLGDALDLFVSRLRALCEYGISDPAKAVSSDIHKCAELAVLSHVICTKNCSVHGNIDAARSDLGCCEGHAEIEHGIAFREARGS